MKFESPQIEPYTKSPVNIDLYSLKVVFTIH